MCCRSNLWGGHHRSPREAGVFVPGLARASLDGLNLGNAPAADIPTPALSPAGSAETLASPPAPRRLEMTPLTLAYGNSMGGEGGKGRDDFHDDESLPQTLPGTLEDTASAPANPEPPNSAPANSPFQSEQMYQSEPATPANKGPSGSGGASASVAPEEALAAPKAAPKAVPKAAPEPTSVSPAVPNDPNGPNGDGNGEGVEPEMKGSMYTDGTYWRICVCIYIFFILIFILLCCICTCMNGCCNQLRMNRYFASVKKGKVKATPEIVKLWGTNNGSHLAFWCYKWIDIIYVTITISYYESQPLSS